jgi:Carboxypeptidase regulatory-like domain
MLRLRLACVAALSSVVLIASGSTPATTLIVSVGDAGTGAFISGAEVGLPSARRTARTTWEGEARFSALSTGKYHIQVRALGYAPGDLDVEVIGDSMGVHFQLERAASALDTVRVTDRKISPRMEEFESRRKMGIGRFLTDSALRDDRSQSMQWVLASRFPGIQVREHGIEAMQPSGFGGDNSCPVLIYIDGFKVSDVSREYIKPESPRLAGGGKGTLVPQPEQPRRIIFPLDNLRPDSLAGVEVYSRTTAPVQYKPLGTYCKVVLLWTRR